MKVPFVIYADFEALVKKIDDASRTNTNKLQEHEVCGYSYVVVGPDGKAYRSEIYRGLDASDHFLDALEKERQRINEIFENL